MQKEAYDFFDKYSDQLIDIINKTNDYDTFYKLVQNYVHLEDESAQVVITVDITKILKKAKINPENYLTFIPEFYHYGNAFIDSENVVIPNYIEMIQWGAYKDADKIKSVSIPGSVVKIEPYAFAGCINLDEIRLEEGIASLSDGAFAYTNLSKEFVIPRSVSYIADDAFDDVEDLHAAVYKDSYAHKWFINSDADESVYEVI